MDWFGRATRAWFPARLGEPTPVQAAGWPALAAGEHALLVAPIGSGKTLAAVLAAIDRLPRAPPRARGGVRALWVSPLKALVYDVERKLRAPLRRIRAAGPWVGELEEEMVFASRVVDVARLGASIGRIQAITRDQVRVVPAPG